MSAYTIDVATIATITKAAGLLLIPGLPESLVCQPKVPNEVGLFGLPRDACSGKLLT